MTSEGLHKRAELQEAYSFVQLRRLNRGRLHLGLAGDLDMAVQPQLYDLCAAVIAMEPTSVELDLTGVTFVSIRVMRALVTMQQELANHRIQVVRGGWSTVVERLQNLLGAIDGNAVH